MAAVVPHARRPCHAAELTDEGYERRGSVQCDGAGGSAVVTRFRRAAAWVGIAALVLFVLVLAVDGSRWVELRITDSLLTVRGSRAAEHCLLHGPLTDCVMHTPAGDETVGGWPIAQYLVAIPLVSLGISSFSILTALAVVSGLAGLGMLVLVAFPIRRLLGTEWAVVLAITIVTGPFVLYSLLPFGEALAAFLTLAFTVVACQRRPAWMFALALLAGITKETAAPFLLVLGLVCARSATDRYLPPRRVLLPLVGGLIAAVVINLLFNVFRFGTVKNIYYTESFTRVPGIGRRFKLALADWFAPNVGVLWFWFLAALLIAGLVVATVVLVIRHRREPLVWLPPAIVVGLIAVFTAGLASWYSTFGLDRGGPGSRCRSSRRSCSRGCGPHVSR